MTDFRAINPSFSVAAQIDREDVVKARELGFHTLINNRPDAEPGVEFPSQNADIAAQHAGLEFVYRPTENHLVYSDLSVDGFITALSGRSAPVLAYCKSGTRCAILWALAASRFQPSDQVFDYLMEQGFEELDMLDEDMADQSARFLGDSAHGANIPEIFRLELSPAQSASNRSKAA